MSDELTIEQKAMAIIVRIIELANQEDDGRRSKIAVGFSADWGGNSMTVWRGNKHSHVGLPESTTQECIDQLYMLLCLGAGSSWA